MGGPGEAVGDELARGERLGRRLLMMSLGKMSEATRFEDGGGDVDGAGLTKHSSGGEQLGREQGDFLGVQTMTEPVTGRTCESERAMSPVPGGMSMMR